MRIEKFITNSIKIQEWWDLLKMANDYEKYIKENLESNIKRIKENKEEIERIEEEIEQLEIKRETVDYKELLNINDKMYDLKQEQVKLQNECEEIKKITNEFLNKYDWSDIESKM